MYKSFSHVDSKKQFLDKKLDVLFNHKTNGFYIELGANDGLEQSNTAYFEFYRNWNGILIEPSKNVFERCIQNRPKSIVYNLACVSNDYQNDTIEGDFDGNMMSSIGGLRNNRTSLYKVPVSTLEKILDLNSVKDIDFLSLDTEGYELNILKGLNLDKYRPKYMLIEIYKKDFENILIFLNNNNYQLLSNFTNYNHIDNPGWDGSHNDYLFRDMKI